MFRLQDISSNDIETFGPGTDLIVSLVAVLLITLAINTNIYKKQMIDLEKVQKNQKQLITQIAARYGVLPESMKDESNSYLIMTSTDSTAGILVVNDVTLQRISFGSHVLFGSNRHELKNSGREVLANVSDVLKDNLGAIKEIQIQGHADTDPVKQDSIYKYKDNLDLAAQRAMEVFKFLQNSGIDPIKHIMSASSFGEYKPVQRKYSDVEFDSKKLELFNKDYKQKVLNRRIEIVLIYRQYSERQ